MEIQTEVCFNPKAGVIHWGCVDHHTACKRDKRQGTEIQMEVCFSPKARVIHWGCVDHHTAWKRDKRKSKKKNDASDNSQNITEAGPLFGPSINCWITILIPPSPVNRIQGIPMGKAFPERSNRYISLSKLIPVILLSKKQRRHEPFSIIWPR